ncbi:MAG TPA: LamG domain-containing protein [Acidimicrobiia bacterium]|jgi:hypothetical protein
MIKRVRVGAAVWAAAFVMTAGAAPPVGAAATQTVADWQMNEGSGASTMVDSGPNGIDGNIGSKVKTGTSVNGAIAYRWDHTKPNTPPAQPERLVIVDDSRLNPGTGDYAITIRFRTTHSYGNMIQKGQSKTKGGQFKWQIPNGKLQCLFKGVGPNGQILKRGVGTGTALKLNDGQWHVARCERTATRVTLTVDGTFVRRTNGPTGNISNTWPLSIAGKTECNQIKVTCDYFAGDIDWVRIERG